MNAADKARQTWYQTNPWGPPSPLQCRETCPASHSARMVAALNASCRDMCARSLLASLRIHAFVQVNFFARQNPNHIVHTSATCYECQRNFDPNVAHFVPISFRINATPNETDYIQGRRTSPSSSWTLSLTASRSVLCTISLVELMVDRFFIPPPMSSPNGSAGFPA